MMTGAVVLDELEPNRVHGSGLVGEIPDGDVDRQDVVAPSKRRARFDDRLDAAVVERLLHPVQEAHARSMAGARAGDIRDQ